MKKPEVRVVKYVKDLEMYVVECRPRYIGSSYNEEWTFVYAYSVLEDAIEKADDVYETMVKNYKKMLKEEHTLEEPEVVYGRELVYIEDDEDEEAN